MYNGEVFAVFLAKNGRVNDVPDAITKGLIKNGHYLIKDVSMGQSNTSVCLEGPDGWYNSVMFDFFDERGRLIELSNTKWNPYVQHDAKESGVKDVQLVTRTPVGGVWYAYGDEYKIAERLLEYEEKALTGAYVPLKYMKAIVYACDKALENPQFASLQIMAIKTMIESKL